MADAGRRRRDVGKGSRPRGRSVRRSEGGGALQIIVGLGLAVAVFGIIYAIMQNTGGLGDKTYMNAYINCMKQIRGKRSDLMSPDEVWKKVHELPAQDIREPKLRELHETLIEYATVMRDQQEFIAREDEIVERLERLELEAAQILGVRVEVK